VANDERVARTIQELVLADFPDPPAPPASESKPVWEQVNSTGTELWLDTGDLEAAQAVWCSEFKALTTNNTLLNKEVQKGIYDDLIAKAAKAIRDIVPEQELVIEIAFILNAYHGMKLVHAFGGKVSVELHTDLAQHRDRTLAYGRRYFAICPSHFIVKVPMTPAGLVATRELGFMGIPVNFTLGFSARQNYFAMLFARPAYVNVFLGRLNSFVSSHNLGDGKNVGEKASLASQRQVRYGREELGLKTKQIAASMRGGSQVSALAGSDVFTMPLAAAAEFEAAPQTVETRVEDDPEIVLAEGVDAKAVGLDTLWDVAPRFLAVVNRIFQHSPDKYRSSHLLQEFEDEGLRDFMPPWTQAEVALAKHDGKIPVLAHWSDQLANRRVGLDALMNLHALQSFCVDQADMDDRIRKML
jgi:transaldolase